MSGRLIVLEGTDGSGKSTQFARLCQRMEAEGFAFQRLVFPQYQEPSSALIKMYLAGEFGSRPGDVNPYASSAFYAVDRYASWKKVWEDWYSAGGLVLADRYTTSNAVHQAAKLPEGERADYLEWLFDLEYRRLELPEPDLVIYLDLPVEISGQMLHLRQEATHTQADIHERDEAYLRRCRESAAEIVRRFGWRRIDCSRNGGIRTPEDIHREVWTLVSALLG